MDKISHTHRKRSKTQKIKALNEKSNEADNLSIIKQENENLEDYEFIDESLCRNVFINGISKSARY
jgi:hypothetical protein